MGMNLSNMFNPQTEPAEMNLMSSPQFLQQFMNDPFLQGLLQQQQMRQGLPQQIIDSF
jgi:hypothetical protein